MSAVHARSYELVSSKYINERIPNGIQRIYQPVNEIKHKETSIYLLASMKCMCVNDCVLNLFYWLFLCILLSLCFFIYSLSPLSLCMRNNYNNNVMDLLSGVQLV